jgi:hypothetical protein
MASVRMTFGSAMDTVVGAAKAVDTTVNAVIKGVDMVDNFVTKAKTEQEKRYKAELLDLDYKIAEEIGMERTLRQKKVKEFVAQNPDSAADYQKNYDEVLTLLKQK